MYSFSSVAERSSLAPTSGIASEFKRFVAWRNTVEGRFQDAL